MVTTRHVIGSLGPIQLPRTAIADAHNHLWIDPVPGADSEAPVLNDPELVQAGLEAFRRLGGTAVLDCQPAGCGRDGLKLRQLSAATGVHVIACTGFHLQRYYPPDHWLFTSEPREAADFFRSELTEGLRETRSTAAAVRAGFIKIACERSLRDTPMTLMEAAAQAALETATAIVVHTERGSAANAILDQLDQFGLPPGRVVLCHMDKRPDPGLHREVADRGALLEYDTFFRTKYQPEQNLWPLLEELALDGYMDRIALATDMAEQEMWRSGESGSQLSDLLTVVKPRLESIGFSRAQVHSLLGGNIITWLALPAEADNGETKEHS